MLTARDRLDWPRYDRTVRRRRWRRRLGNAAGIVLYAGLIAAPIVGLAGLAWLMAR